MKYLIWALIFLVSQMAVMPSAQAADLTEQELEKYIMTVLCDDYVGNLQDDVDAVVQAKAYWRDQKSAIPAQHQEDIMEMYISTIKPEAQKLGVDEVVVTCANQKLVDSIEANSLNQPKLSDAEELKLKTYEDELAGYQARLAPLQEKTRISAWFGLFLTSSMMEVVEFEPSEDKIMSYSLGVFKNLTSALEAQDAAKTKFGTNKSDVAMLLAIDEGALNMCLWSSYNGVREASESKNARGMSAYLVQSALWSSLINFRQDLGGAKSDKQTPELVSKLLVFEDLTPTEKALASQFNTICHLSYKPEIVSRIYTPLVLNPLGSTNG